MILLLVDINNYNMKQENAIQVLIQVCEKATKAGVFSLGESSLVLQALEAFGVKAPQPEGLDADAEAEVVEDKKDKK